MAPRTASTVRSQSPVSAKGKSNLVTPQEVEKRRLLVINNKVYDAPAFISQHPGGDILMTYAGRDATDVFSGFHRGSKESFAQLEKLYVGELSAPLKDTTAESPFEKDVRALGAKLAAQGLFNADPVWYTIKTASTALIGAVGAALCLWPGSGFAMKMAAALVFALFWQQCGWLSHDYAHHGVFKNRRLNDFMVLFFGGLCQGFSLSWWRSKHNRHHAVPNQHETADEAHDGDPDIDTLPFLAWSKKLAKKAKETILAAPSSSTNKKTDEQAAASPSLWASFLNVTLSNQSFLYFPLLCFARFSWTLQSAFFAFEEERKATEQELKADPKKARFAPVQYPMAERIGLALHWICYFALIAYTMDLTTALCFVLLSQTAAGFLLALVFGVGHNGMAIFDEGSRPGYFEMQVRSTRDIDDVGINGWLCGGLHFQVTHHMFPTLPRHNLVKATPMVKELCRKHKVPYHCTGLMAGTWEVLSHLADVAKEIASGPM